MRVLIPLLLVVAALPPVAVESCAPASEIVPGASQTGVTGVVERTVVGSNPLPWGRSVSVVTRLWGTARVERWETSGRGDDCSHPRTVKGTRTFERVGGDPPARLVPADGLVSQLEEAALAARFGDPVVTEPGALDRFMAWIRVWPSIPILVALGVAAVAAWMFRRRRPPPEQYLF